MLSLEITLPNQSYPILIKKNLLSQIKTYIEPYMRNKKTAIITDKNVYAQHGQSLMKSIKNLANTHLIVLEPGETSKSISVLEKVYKELLSFGMTKSDLLIAFGGGVIGDLTGFAAATYLRGLPFIQIPTSLIAQVDSSIGGKTAVNLIEGKNLIGSFYHPAAVFIDPVLLTSLDSRHFSDGMAEVIKYGCIYDQALFHKLEQANTDHLITEMDEIIYRCCQIKRNIVIQDEKDNGKRMLLNFGHTLGHGIEKVFDYTRFTHGEGVAMGMYHITQKSEAMHLTNMGTSEKIKNVLLKYKLPYLFPELDENALLKTVMSDKKSRGNKMNLILLKHIGSSFIHTIEKNDMKLFI